MKVSVVILTFNEAPNLRRCLHALQWCDDIIVVDSGSTDGTVELARNCGARTLFRSFDNFAAQRNFGLSKGCPKHEWVLHLDADEVVTEAFTEELLRLEPQPDIDAYNVPSKLMFHERWLRYAGMYPVFQVRIGHRDRLRFKQVGHGQREDLPGRRIGVFHEPYLHYNFSHGLTAWLQKHIKYAADEARLLGEQQPLDVGSSGVQPDVARWRALKALSRNIPVFLRPVARALYMLTVKRAFLDGHTGFLYVGMLSVYEAMIAILYYEARLMRKLEATEHRKSPPP